jgi:hypothetical protein
MFSPAAHAYREIFHRHRIKPHEQAWMPLRSLATLFTNQLKISSNKFSIIPFAPLAYGLLSLPAHVFGIRCDGARY